MIELFGRLDAQKVLELGKAGGFALETTETVEVVAR
jgi:hypothetical protein